MLSKMKSKGVSELWLKLYKEGSYQTLTKLSVNCYKNNIYVLIVGHIRRNGCHPASEVFLSFFLDDKTSALDIFRSCSFIPHRQFRDKFSDCQLLCLGQINVSCPCSNENLTFLRNSQRYIWAIIHWWVTPHLFFALGGKRVAGSSLFATYIEPGSEGRKLHLKICSQNTPLESCDC